MPESADQVYKTPQQIVAEVLAAFQARIPDANLGPDSIFRIWTEVFANSESGLYLMAQLLHDDLFIQTMNALALIRKGEEIGRPQKNGTVASGSVRFSGAGGTPIPIGAQVAASRPFLEDALTFVTTAAGTIPNPGIPDAPVAADAAVAGALTGTFEYAVTFLTAGGETELGDSSAPLVLAASKANLTAIPVGGPGTVSRNIYRRVDGGPWGFLVNIPGIVTTVYGPDNAAATGALPPDTSTAERITLAAQAEDVGDLYNVAVGTITSLVSVEPGLSDVINLVAFAGGTEPEDIETFRTEVLKRVRAPQSGSREDLESWATDIEGVESATAFKNIDLAGAAAPGTVSVRISGPNGTIPDAAKVAEVQAYLDLKDLANITIQVGTFVAHNIDSTVVIDLAPGFVLADISAQVTQAISEYITSVPVGGVVYRAGIYAAVFGMPGIDTLVVSVPAADVAVAATEKPVPHTITVT